MGLGAGERRRTSGARARARCSGCGASARRPRGPRRRVRAKRKGWRRASLLSASPGRPRAWRTEATPSTPEEAGLRRRPCAVHPLKRCYQRMPQAFQHATSSGRCVFRIRVSRCQDSARFHGCVPWVRRVPTGFCCASPPSQQPELVGRHSSRIAHRRVTCSEEADHSRGSDRSPRGKFCKCSGSSQPRQPWERRVGACGD